MSNITTGASLRISTEEANTDFISSALQISPSVQHSKGERRSKRNPKSSIFEESLWIYNSPLSDIAELQKHIENLLDLLESRRETFELIRSRVTLMDIFCLFGSENGQGSMEFDPLLLQRLAKQQISLILDLYPPTSVV
ncbi:MAG TPA: DUF4279 domain-containing protein [Verrucomicrobiae bacterium]